VTLAPSPWAIAARAFAQPAAPAWRDAARPDQLPPDTDWYVWLVLAGRGWGKTRVGAEWVAERARTNPGCRIALVAATFADGRDTMVEGESGLLAVLADNEFRGGSQDAAWNRSLGELYLTNGSRFKLYSSQKPRQLRGPQHHFAWADEISQWDDAGKGTSQDTTWSNLTFGTRLPMAAAWPKTNDNRIVVSTTPKPLALLTTRDVANPGLMQQPSTAITRGRTLDNIANLSDTYRRQVIDPIAGTRLGLQELDGQILEDVEGALWTRDRDKAESERLGLIETVQGVYDLASNVLSFRGVDVELGRRIIALDPAAGGESGDDQGTVVVAVGRDRRFYVLHSAGMHASPMAWLAAVDALRDRFGADMVVYERDGSLFLPDLLAREYLQWGAQPISTGGAGKRLRAEPVQALYVQHKVTHVLLPGASLASLEEQMTSFTGAAGEKSPGELDALVHGLTALMKSSTPARSISVAAMQLPPSGPRGRY